MRGAPSAIDPLAYVEYYYHYGEAMASDGDRLVVGSPGEFHSLTP